MRVAFLGLGRMGVRMAVHVMDAGHELTVWNRTPGRAGRLVGRGATEAHTAAEAVRGADQVVLMLFGPDSVREVLQGLSDSDATVINATTVGPRDAREFAAMTAGLGMTYVDAPVAGSLAPAEAGTLGVLVGAAQSDYETALPLLHTWGDADKVRRVGDVGAGSALKLCVNQGLGVMAAGLGESLRLGQQLGLDRTALLDVLGGTAYGWFLNQKRGMLDSGDFSDTTFSIDLMVKDLTLAVDAADVELPVTQAVTERARAAARLHHDDDYAVMAGQD